MKSKLVPTNQAKLILPSLSSYINEKGDDLISHPPYGNLNDSNYFAITRAISRTLFE